MLQHLRRAPAERTSVDGERRRHPLVRRQAAHLVEAGGETGLPLPRGRPLSRVLVCTRIVGRSLPILPNLAVQAGPTADVCCGLLAALQLLIESGALTCGDRMIQWREETSGEDRCHLVMCCRKLLPEICRLGRGGRERGHGRDHTRRHTEHRVGGDVGAAGRGRHARRLRRVFRLAVRLAVRRPLSLRHGKHAAAPRAEARLGHQRPLCYR
mmetsp:Transcript_3243/g.7052  ORF Transcript_3243/g.7052 Transcript_3243/m.7052 type:complete len:212 (-) Transcript_3243:625-1260(-)